MKFQRDFFLKGTIFEAKIVMLIIDLQHSRNIYYTVFKIPLEK